MNSTLRCSPNYFSIPDIMATHERLPCRFETTVPRLGFLDQSSDSEDLAVGTNVELPYWLARALCTQRLRTVSVEMPKFYKEAYREILKADASVVDLHKLCLYFYEFGLCLSTLNHRDAPAINSMLVQAFKDRFRMVMDWAQNSGSDPSGLQKLDTLERELYREGQAARARLDSLLRGAAGQISAADMVVSYKKRKLAGINI
ncbi:DNA replication complex GINS protein PSF3 [Anabrus simplex]|uniref:DNA replication complex GINS protein PSF3 n=1 Tax=Anabrus simplex TaxID=316456 RepID=UPI0034DD7502